MSQATRKVPWFAWMCAGACLYEVLLSAIDGQFAAAADFLVAAAFVVGSWWPWKATPAAGGETDG